MEKTTLIRKTALMFLLALGLVFGGMTGVASAASKAPKLSVKSVSLYKGISTTIKVKNKPSGAKVVWSSKNSKIAKVKNGTITGVKKGSTNVICKVTYTESKKKVTKKLSTKVTVKAVTKSLLNKTNVGKEHKSANGLTTKDNGLMRKGVSSLDLMSVMSLGWNLGNQMETYSPNATTITECETSAGNPVVTQKTFDGLKTYGVNTVRIPVGWSNLMSTDGKYTISEDYLNRVEEIINYALNDEMYVIINIHWDGGWWGMFGDADQTVRDKAWKKYETMWKQIANRYKEYSDRLIFEGANEELGTRLNDDWEHPENGETNPTGTLTRAECYKVAAQINQKFVDIVRATGGNNKYRHLLIPGDGTILNNTCSKNFVMPSDITTNGNTKLSVSVHYYEPSDYGISRTATTSWGYRDSWGTDDDYTYMTTQMNKLKKFTKAGYGVIIGECGCAVTTKDNIPDYLTELFKQCLADSYCPVMWDEGSYYNRKDGYFTYSDVGDVFSTATNSTPTIPSGAVFDTTGIPQSIVADNQNPKVVYTWEGEFMRHTDADSAALLGLDASNPGKGYTTSVSDGLLVDFNVEFWHFHLNADWDNIEQPCIRVYPADNTQSQTADLQLAYTEEADSAWMFQADYDQINADGTINEDTAWVGKYLNLKKSNLEKYPWIWLTTNTYTGVSFVKVEICDGAYNADGTAFEAN